MSINVLLSLLVTCTAPSSREIEAEAFIQRNKIAQISMDIRVETKHHPDEQKTLTWKAKLHSDNLKTRMDVAIEKNYAGTVEKEQFTECSNCLWPDSIINLTSDTRVSAQIRPWKRGDSACIFDPRVMGCIPRCWGTYYWARIDHCIGFQDRGPVTVTVENYENQACNVLRYKTQKVVDVTVYFNIECGNHPIKIVSKSGKDDSLYEVNMVSKLQPAGDGIWFPSSISYDEHTGGKLTKAETITITNLEINKPIDTGKFTLAGMNIPEGKLIADYTRPVRERDQVWTGGKLMSSEAYAKMNQEKGMPYYEPIPIAIEPEKRSRSWLYYLAGLLALAGVTFLVRVYRRR